MKLLKKIKRVYRKLNAILDYLEVEKGDRLAVMWDMVCCKVFKGCTFDEYITYNLHRYKNRYRKYFILINKKRKVYDRINPVRYTMHKWECAQKIKRGIQREMVLASECGEQGFVEFLKKHQKIITKPEIGSLGRDIRVFEYTTPEAAAAIYKELPGDTICEQYIKQHEKMSSLNPSSVNSIRICALLENGKQDIVSASLKSGGIAGIAMDNMHKRGVGATVDIETGVVLGRGYDYHGHSYVYHPVTGTQIVGFQIPYWKETLELLEKTHRDVADCPFLGWDVAIAEYGPEIIEINGAPGPKLMQWMDKLPKGKKLMDYAKRHKK